MPGQWASSTRRNRLPADWQRRRAATKARAGGRCEWVEHGERCTKPGRDADHIQQGDNHNQLQWLCRDHHAAKSSREGNTRWSAMRASRRHPREPHPGAL